VPYMAGQEVIKATSV